MSTSRKIRARASRTGALLALALIAGLLNGIPVVRAQVAPPVIFLNVPASYLGPEVVVSGRASSPVGVPNLQVVVEGPTGTVVFSGPPTTALLPPPGDIAVSWRVPLTLVNGAYQVRVQASVGGETTQAEATFAVVDAEIPDRVLVAGDAEWAYWDRGSEPNPVLPPVYWHTLAFDASLWPVGRAPLGYGGSQVTTTASVAGGLPVLAQYFRHEFVVDDLSDYDALNLSLLRNDGAVVYLNGVELGRTNMAPGAVGYATPAVAVSDQTIELRFSPDQLVVGGNVLAIEVHQAPAGIANLSMAASLVAVPDATPKVSDNSPGTLVLAAGDMANCSFDGDEAVAGQMAELFDTDAGVFLGLGDLAYGSGSFKQFTDCYEPTIGVFKDVTWPAPGNHEHYTSPNAAGYRQYFGEAAGPLAGPSGGLWYSFDLDDDWHVIALDSDCQGQDVLPGAVAGDGYAVGSAQERWLRADLEANQDKNVLAFFHHPPYTNNHYVDHEYTWPLWRALAEYGADITLHGHEHHYERYAPLDYWGNRAAGAGVREFIIGSGGTFPRYATRPQAAESDFRGTFPSGTLDFGVLQLWLRADGYEWRWESINGLAPVDAGTSGLNPPMPRANISGTVTNSRTGEPVGSLTVCAAASRTGLTTCGRSDADGRYTIGPLVNGSYTVASTSTRHVGQPVAVALAAPTPSVANLVVEQLFELSGTVRKRAGGEPFGGVSVCAKTTSNERSCVQSDTAGRWRIEVVGGDYEVLFEAPGYVTECYPACGRATPVARDLGGIDFSLAPIGPATASISGIVKSLETGDRLAGIEVCAIGAVNTSPSCSLTNASGAYVVGGLNADSYVVRYRDPGGSYVEQCYRIRPCDRPLLVAVTGALPRTAINASLAGVGATPTPSPTVGATATPAPTAAPTATATPRPTATPTAAPTATPRPTGTPTATPTATAAPTATRAPTATATPRPTGTPTATATPTAAAAPTATRAPTATATPRPTATPTATPRATAAPTPTAPAATPTATPTVSGGSISGQVTVLATGEPIFGSRVCAKRGLPAGEFCSFSRLDGSFTIRNLSSGNYSVSAGDIVGRYVTNSAGSLPCDRPFLYGVTATRSVTDIAIALDPIFSSSVPTPTPTPFVNASATISGTVTRAGSPAAGVEVCATSSATLRVSCTTTVGDGRYAINGLETGNYRVAFDGAALCYRQQIGCITYTLVGVVSPGSRTLVNATL